MNLRFTPLILICIAWSADGAFADGGLIRAQRRTADHLLTVFTSPTPLRAGPVDISILVQDSKSGVSSTECPMLVRISNDDPSQAVIAEATNAAATNKLMQATSVVLPTAGRWNVHISSVLGGRPEEIAFPIVVEPPLPHWLAFWPWLLLPPAAIAVFGIHRYLVARAVRGKNVRAGA